MPAPVGIAWDVLVIGFTALVVVVCVDVFLNPTGASAAYPVWYRAFSYLICFAGVCLIGAYLLLDRRPIRRVFPRLAGLTVRTETIVGLLAMLVIVVAWGVATVLALS